MGSERTLRIALGLLALVGIGIAGYLTIVHYEDAEVACIAGGESCSKVQDSEYAELAGVPVPLIGLIGYVTVLVAAALPGDPGRLLGLFAGLVGVGFSIYLTYLEVFEIEAICHWCVASAVVMCIVLAVALLRAARFLGRDGPAEAI
jgi:uncharacterized membrane protein